MRTMSILVKSTAVLLALLFAMPMVPAMYIGDHQAPRDLSIEGTGLPHSGPRVPTVVVGATNSGGATQRNPARHVVRTNNNYIYVVYESQAQIWFSRSTDNGQTFSTPKNISNDTTATPTHQSYTPAIASNGTAIFVVWSFQDTNNANEEYIAFRRSSDNGTTWVPPLNQPGTKLTHVGSATFGRQYPAIAVNDTAVYVVCMSRMGNQLYFYKSLNSGNTWGWGGANDELYLAGANDPSIAVSNESVYITYTYSPAGNTDIGYIFSTKGRTIGFTVADFSAVVDLYNVNTNAIYSNVVASGKNVYVVWQEGVAGGDEIEFRNTTNQGTAWTPAIGQVPTQVSNSTGNARNPSVTLDTTGNVYVTWRDSAVHASYDVIYTEREQGVWLDPLYITSDQNTANWPSTNPFISNNRLDIVWTNGTPVNVLYDGEYVGGSAPALNWTGENGYISDGVNPDTGTTGHTYTWRVKYTDADNDAPLAGYPKVYIDKDLNGDFNGPGEQVSMSQVDATDHTYSDGKLYTYSTRLKFVGNYTYMFVGADTNGRISRGDPMKVQNGPQIISVNEPPKLSWVQDWGYITDGLDPDTGFPDTTFTYKIVYSDILNESVANGFPKLYIDMDNNGNFTDPGDTVVTMIAVNPGDNAFDDGKIYYYNTTLPLGTYKYMVYAEDLVGLSAQSPAKNGPTVIGKGTAPVLTPTGEPGYITDGADPDSGADTTQFNFRVRYTDVDGDLPATGYPLIGLDLNRDGTFTANEKFAMTEADLSDTNVRNGKVYIYSKTFSQLGLYNYSFEAVDTNGSISNVLTYSGPNVNSINKAPALTWLGSGGYSTDGLDPETGNVNSTVFDYQVLYSDENGDTPMAGSPKVWIDLNMDGLETAGEWFNMTDTNPSSTDYVNGKKYDYNTTFVDPGIYSYKFLALDTKGAPATGTPILKHDGPIVSVPPNLPPKLVLLGTTGYNGTGVSPATGNLDTTFIYKVKYVDLENDTPGKDWPRVYIDTDGDGTSDSIGVMQPEDTKDMSVVNGKVYVFKTKLPIEGDKYAYKFKAEDANSVTAQGTGSIYDQVYYGPKVIVNKAPMLQFLGAGNFMNKGVDPDKAAENSTFTYRVIYRDPEGDKPKDGKVYLRIDLDKNKAIDTTDPNIVMTEANAQDQNYADGKEYTATYKFVENGDYGYRFEAQDPFNNTAGGQASIDYIPGPVVTEPVPNRAPTLTFTGETNFQTLGVNPLSALKGSKFTFRVKYIDVDNDAAAVGNPILTIGGQTYPMTAVDASDTNYVDGKIYTVDVTLAKDQTYTYSFAVKNVINQTASLGPLEGPVVTKKVSTPKAQALPDMLWLIILIVIAIVVAIIGYLVGARKKKEPEPQYRRQPRTRTPESRRPDRLKEVPMVPLTGDDVDDVEVKKVADDKVPKGPVPSKEESAGTKTDLKASAEQPTSSGEDAKKAPGERPGPPVEAETKPELKAHQSDSEAPADDKDIKKDPEAPKTEEKKPADVDKEIDSILDKLDK
jgi:hypothetical protein